MNPVASVEHVTNSSYVKDGFNEIEGSITILSANKDGVIEPHQSIFMQILPTLSEYQGHGNIESYMSTVFGILYFIILPIMF